jgi:glycosyltransferase involved in cell wall biosynthesis
MLNSDNSKILHYFLGFNPLHGGGLMLYVKDLVEEQKKNGYDISLIMPGEYKFTNNNSKIEFYESYKGIPVYQIINPLPISFNGFFDPISFMEKRCEKVFYDFLKQEKINIIHIHSLIGLPKELVVAAKKLAIKTIFTTHDYFGLCPKVNFFDWKKNHCYDFENGYKCLECNENSNSLIKQKLIRNINIYRKYNIFDLLIKLLSKTKKYINFSFIKNINSPNDKELKNNKVFFEKKADEFKKFRDYQIDLINQFDLIIFNSSVTKNVFSNYIDIDNIKNKILPVSHSNIKDNRNRMDYQPIFDDKIRFIFMGYLDQKKGFYNLIDNLNKIKKINNSWELNIYGDYSNVNTEKFDSNQYKFHGKYSHEDFPEMFSENSLLIIPSQWKETFGFIGLEAFSYAMPILVSENVGFKDILKNKETGLVYNKNQIKNSLLDILNNPEQLSIINKNIKKENFKFDIENHVIELNRIYSKVVYS